MSKEMCVRLWPLNPRQGRTVANFTHKGQKYTGGKRPQWYICSQALAAELGELRLPGSLPGSQTIFQVVTPEEKAKLEQEENTQFLAQVGVLQGAVQIPGDIRNPATHDLRESEAPVEEPAEAPEPAGRAAALPPPRQPTSIATETGAVTSEETPKGEVGHRSSWDGDDEDE